MCTYFAIELSCSNEYYKIAYETKQFISMVYDIRDVCKQLCLYFYAIDFAYVETENRMHTEIIRNFIAEYIWNNWRESVFEA